MTSGTVELDQLEIHSGVATGSRRSPRPETGALLQGTPYEVLEHLLADALSHPPCYVMFSGGRDSSAMLATAAQVARDRGLPAPIPLTARFAEHPQTWEAEWQELVISHVGVPDWVRFDVTGELDALGELARGTLDRYGSFWPVSSVSMALFARQVAPATIVTGGGGDELFTRWPWARAPWAVTRRRRPWRKVVKHGAYNALPLPARQWVRRRQSPSRMPLRWLTPAGQAQFDARFGVARGRPAASWGDGARRFLESRYLECVRTNSERFAADAGARLVEPFYDPSFVGAMARAAPREGFAGRTVVMRELFGHLLPPKLLARPTKALFTTTLWGPEARRFAADWDGSGLDLELVDPDRLRDMWGSERPDGRSVSALQAAWLSGRRHGI